MKLIFILALIILSSVNLGLSTKINLSEEASGVYLMKVYSDFGVQNIRLIKK